MNLTFKQLVKYSANIYMQMNLTFILRNSKAVIEWAQLLIISLFIVNN